MIRRLQRALGAQKKALATCEGKFKPSSLQRNEGSC